MQNLNFEGQSNFKLYIMEKSILPDFEIQDGKKYAIIYQKKGNEYTDPCPFCGKPHIHGNGDGHRIAHCKQEIKRGRLIQPIPDSCLLSDGSKAFQEDGYLLKEY